MTQADHAQRIFLPVDGKVSTYLLTWVEAWLLDCKVRNLSPKTLAFYREKIGAFCDFCEAQVITRLDQINPNDIRKYLLYLEEQKHNPGGIHAAYRTVKAFLRWYENEAEPDDWKNPIRKVKAPKVPEEPLQPVELATVKAMLATCKADFHGLRDKAIMLSLLDTGARAQEFVDLTLSDVNLITGEVLIRQGKGRKPRTVFLGAQSRKAIRAYLKHRQDSNVALWCTGEGERLKYRGLYAVIERRAAKAKVAPPSLHDFRRCFALTMLRKGCDVITLSRLMGHTSLVVLRRYLEQLPEDLQKAHALASPVDGSL